jgi:hypothetical protein
MTSARTIRLFAGLFSAALLIVLVALPWTRPTDASHTADFAPAPGEGRAPDAPRHGSVGTVWFPQTGHSVNNDHGFLTFWRSRGSVLLLGYPLSDAFEEGGRMVQYFERARLEYHAELQGGPYQVQLGLLGRETTAGRSFAAAAPRKGTRFFPETGHNLAGKFRPYWEKRGGLAGFGFPISEELQEPTPDGTVRTVQYFERARLVSYPERMSGFYRNAEARHNILLATLHEIEPDDLGRQVLAGRAPQAKDRAAFGQVPDWSPELWDRRIEVDLSQQQLYAYEGDLLVYQAPVATGKNGFTTPTGTFAIYHKTREQTMRGSADGETWNVPRVPWVQYIVGGVAIHGTYWHDRFGTGVRMSHGCINVGMDDAEWLYQWASIGTPVTVRR